jgi:hypothetical protein
MLVFVFVLCCQCRLRPLRQAGLSCRGDLPCVLIRLRNLRCEAADVITRTVYTLIMMMMMMMTCYVMVLSVADCIMPNDWMVDELEIMCK